MRKSSRRSVIRQVNEPDKVRYLGGRLTPCPNEHGDTRIPIPNSQASLYHVWASLDLCTYPIPDVGQEHTVVPGEKRLIINGYVLISKAQLDAFGIPEDWQSGILRIAQPVARDFSMSRFMNEQAQAEAGVLFDLTAN